MLALLIRGGLRFLSWFYGVGVQSRNKRFDHPDSSKNNIVDCGVPVVSVGNLTTGGTGKTPVVCFLAKWFRSRDVRVAIVSRGYGRGQADSNDEALELYARLPDVPHVQDPDRVAAARIAVEELEAQVILMDDGFQHRRLHRDLNIVLIDATVPFGYGFLLPRGLLREPLSSLKRADLVILSRCDCVEKTQLQKIEQEIRGYSETLSIIQSAHVPAALMEHPDKEISVTTLQGENIAVFSAIGNPEAFKTTLKQCGANIVDSRELPDHDPYEPETVESLRTWILSLKHSVSRVVCTHKDLVKLATDSLGGVPVSALIIELQLLSNDEIAASLTERLESIAAKIT